MLQRNLPLEYEIMRDEITDIGGIRVICSYITDIYAIADMLKQQDTGPWTLSLFPYAISICTFYLVFCLSFLPGSFPAKSRNCSRAAAGEGAAWTI